MHRSWTSRSLSIHESVSSLGPGRDCIRQYCGQLSRTVQSDVGAVTPVDSEQPVSAEAVVHRNVRLATVFHSDVNCCTHYLIERKRCAAALVTGHVTATLISFGIVYQNSRDHTSAIESLAEHDRIRQRRGDANARRAHRIHDYQLPKS